jgi:hypothetical protein
MNIEAERLFVLASINLPLLYKSTVLCSNIVVLGAEFREQASRACLSILCHPAMGQGEDESKKEIQQWLRRNLSVTSRT